MTIANVVAGERYEVSLLLFGRVRRRIQIITMGRSAPYGGDGTIVMEGESLLLTEEFVARKDRVEFVIRNRDQTGTVFLLGAAVRRLLDASQ